MISHYGKKGCGKNRILKIFFLCFIFILCIRLIWPHTRFSYYRPIFFATASRVCTREIVMKPGEEFRLYVYTMQRGITFQSSDFKVASVSILGKVTAWRTGTAVIKVTAGKKVYKCRVQVVDLASKKLTIKVGRSKYLRVKNAMWGVKFYSSNPKIATVNRFGKVHGKQKGTVIITATYRGKTLKCKVVIK